MFVIGCNSPFNVQSYTFKIYFHQHLAYNIPHCSIEKHGMSAFFCLVLCLKIK